MKNINLWILFFAFLLIISNSCQKKLDDPFGKSVIVYLNINNPKGIPLSGAKLYVLDDIKNYEMSVETDKGFKAIDSTQSSNGKASFIIEGGKDYYLYITYTDPINNYIYTNEGYSSIINKLPSKLNVSVDINLTPANGNLAFWSDNKNKLPITIKIGAETFVINNSTTTAPQSKDEPNLVMKTVRGSKVRFYATNADGCVWTENISINKGEFNTFLFPECQLGQIVFYTKSINKDLLPIRILINENQPAGDITLFKNTYACGDNLDSTKVVNKEPGLHTYVAYSKDNKCAWTGTFVSQKGQCTVVQLEVCK